jgi:CubicO group peptidase (beta-lactamase class C family)
MTNYLKPLLNKTYLIVFWVVAICSSTPLVAQPIQKELEKIAKEVGIPGLQVAYSKGKEQKLYTYGVKRIDSKDIVKNNTRFQAASLTKVVAAYTFFRLLDKGLIELDRPLLEYYAYDRLKNTIGGDKITARMVLTHRSGLLNWEGDVPSAKWRATPLTLQFDPGSNYMYSGEGFYFLQETLEHITNKSFQQLVEEEVLQPFYMTHSNIVWNDTLEMHTATGHYSLEKPRRMGKYAKTNAAYTLYTTATDYTKFIQKALIAGEGLKKSTHMLMLSKAAEAKKGKEVDLTDKYVPCAMGLRMQINEVGTAYWHTGSNPGFRCFFITYPKSKESLVAFMNTDEGFPAMKKMMQLFLNKNQTFWAYDWRLGELD